MNQKVMSVVVVLACVAGCVHVGTMRVEQPKASESTPVEPPKVAEGKPVGPSEAAVTNVAVEVNGHRLLTRDLESDVEKLMACRRFPEEQRERVRRELTDQLVLAFVSKILLRGEAEKKGVIVTDETRRNEEQELIRKCSRRPNGPKSLTDWIAQYPLGAARARQDFEDTLFMRQLLQQEVLSKVVLDEKEVDARYQTIRSRFEQQTQAAHVSETNALSRIQALKKQLDGLTGEALRQKFTELARTHAEGASKSRAGVPFEISKNFPVREFADAAFALEPLVVSEPVRTRFGYHLILVTKKIPAVEKTASRPAVPEKVWVSEIPLNVLRVSQKPPTREEVVRWLEREAQQKATQAYYESLHAAATIVAPSFPHLFSSSASDGAKR